MEIWHWSTPEVIDSLSREPFGEELIIAVADNLQKGLYLENNHRDYCGHGLSYSNGMFVLYEVWDVGSERKLIWENRDDFIKFMSKQSDYSLCGKSKQIEEMYEKDLHKVNNQRITKERLLEFATR